MSTGPIRVDISSHSVARLDSPASPSMYKTHYVGRLRAFPDFVEPCLPSAVERAPAPSGTMPLVKTKPRPPKERGRPLWCRRGLANSGWPNQRVCARKAATVSMFQRGITL
jgi:hypothetical protein